MMVIAFQSSPIFSLPRAPLGFPTILLRFTSVDAIAFLIQASFALSDYGAELEQFAVDARRTREWVGPAHLATSDHRFLSDLIVPDGVIAIANRAGSPCDATGLRSPA